MTPDDTVTLARVLRDIDCLPTLEQSRRLVQAVIDLTAALSTMTAEQDALRARLDVD